MTPIKKEPMDFRSEGLRVLSSDEESPKRETEVDDESEREAQFGGNQNEDIDVDAETPLRRPMPTDHPLDITPRNRESREGLGLVDEPDAETIEKYFEAERAK